MSRCFPFPSPGYERQHRLEDLISKEAKHKEKKDKDRKKDKDKKEKDGSEKQTDKKDRKGKHKDRKEKHGDKKKDKDDWGKDKEKSSISEESTVAGKLDERSGDKVHPEVHKKYSSVEGEGKWSTLSQGQNGKKPLQNILPQATKEARFMQELDRRTRDDEKERGSQFLQRVVNADTMDLEAAAGNAFWNPSQVLAEAKHNDGYKSFQGKKHESQGHNGEFIGKMTVQTLPQMIRSKNEGIPRPLEEDHTWRLGENEKYIDTVGNEHGDKRKDRHKKNRRKDKHNEKEEKKKKEKVNNVNIENEKSEPDNSNIFGRHDLASAASNRTENVLKDAIGTALDEGSIRKRKDLDTNDFIHESDIRPNKVQRLALNQSTDHGRKLEASSKSSSDKHAVPNNVQLDHYGWLNNGIIESKKPSPSEPNSSDSIMFSDQIVIPPKMRHPDCGSVNETLRMHMMKDHSAEASKRPPHPDSKYLSQILTVPTVRDRSEDDDQEWLFCKKCPPSKPESEVAAVTEGMHVWSEALHIESADVYALPYVIPY